MVDDALRIRRASSFDGPKRKATITNKKTTMFFVGQLSELKTGSQATWSLVVRGIPSGAGHPLGQPMYLELDRSLWRRSYKDEVTLEPHKSSTPAFYRFMSEPGPHRFVQQNPNGNDKAGPSIKLADFKGRGKGLFLIRCKVSDWSDLEPVPEDFGLALLPKVTTLIKNGPSEKDANTSEAFFKACLESRSTWPSLWPLTKGTK